MQRHTKRSSRKGGSTVPFSGVCSTPSFLLGGMKSEEAWPVLKFAIMIFAIAAIVATFLISPNDILRSRGQFKSWYAQYEYQFSAFARDNCADQYSVYLYGTRRNTSDQTLSGAGKFTLFVQPMINCLLTSAGNYIQYQLSSAQVVLGLTPTIIALLGSSSEEVCLLALIGRRRLLGLLLCAASPSIYTERAFKYQDADKIIEDLDSSHAKNTVIKTPRPLFVVLEYIAVLGAIANIATLNWHLGTKTVNSVNPNTILMPMLWSLIGVMSHLAGMVLFNMRARRVPDIPDRRPIFERISYEFTWLPEKPGDMIYFTNIKETPLFTFLAWFFSLLTIFHIILGTLILSSTNFVGPKDAFGIMSRYILSVVVCRIILVYELAALQMEYKRPGTGPRTAS